MRFSVCFSFLIAISASFSAFADINLGTGRTISKFAPGLNHSCAILDNALVKCWGKNEYGQLGLGDKIDRVTAAQLGNNLPYVDLGIARTANEISVGEFHTCALLDNGTVKCWGENSQGQLGTAGYTEKGGHPGDMMSLGPVNLGFGRTAVALHLGDRYTCVTLDNGSNDCWGEGF